MQLLAVHDVVVLRLAELAQVRVVLETHFDVVVVIVHPRGLELGALLLLLVGLGSGLALVLLGLLRLGLKTSSASSFSVSETGTAGARLPMLV